LRRCVCTCHGRTAVRTGTATARWRPPGPVLPPACARPGGMDTSGGRTTQDHGDGRAASYAGTRWHRSAICGSVGQPEAGWQYTIAVRGEVVRALNPNRVRPGCGPGRGARTGIGVGCDHEAVRFGQRRRAPTSQRTPAFVTQPTIAHPPPRGGRCRVRRVLPDALSHPMRRKARTRLPR